MVSNKLRQMEKMKQIRVRLQRKNWKMLINECADFLQNNRINNISEWFIDIFQFLLEIIFIFFIRIYIKDVLD